MRTVLSLLLLALPLNGQTWLTVPDGHLAAEAPSRTGIPGLGPQGSRQYVIGAAHLQPMIGRRIGALAFRRDANWPETGVAGSSTMVVRIGAAARSPGDAEPAFRVNLPQPLEVFRGAVVIPSANVNAAPPAWSAPNVIVFPFGTAFTYQGGDLAIEIDGSAAVPASAWWPVDAVEDELRGTVTDEGHACGPRSMPNLVTGTIDDGSLVLGGTAVFDYFGQASANALLLIGASTHASPINLGFLGAPTCELRVDFFAVVPRPVLDTGLQSFDDMAWARVPLPNLPALLNGQLVAQWFELGAVIATSQTMRFQIAGRRPSLGMVSLLQFPDGGVELRPRQAPVFGFLVN